MLDTTRKVATPEGIELTLRLAGPVPRAMAWAVDLAIRGLNAAMRRDSASGNGMDIAVIDGQGFRRLDEADVLKRHKALKLPASWTP